MDKSINRTTTLIISCLIQLNLGMVFCWSVVVTPLAEYYSEITGEAVSPGDLNIVFTLVNFFFPIFLILGGNITKKLGMKPTIFLGGILFGGGIVVSSFSESILLLAISYGIVSTLGYSIAYNCVLNNAVKFYYDKKGMASGAVTASFGLSTVLLSPVVNFLIENYDVMVALRIIGAVFITCVCFLSLIIKEAPEPVDTQMKEIAIAESNAKNWKEMIKDKFFYLQFAIGLCLGIFGLMTFSQASPIAQSMIGMSANSAAFAVSVLALFNVLGRMGAGVLSDSLGRINTMLLAFILALIGLVILFTLGSGDNVRFFIAMAMIGTCYGSILGGVFPGLVVDQFGVKYNTINYGVVVLSIGIASTIGPSILTSSFSLTGTYQPAFLIAGAICLLGILLTIIYGIGIKSFRTFTSAKHKIN